MLIEENIKKAFVENNIDDEVDRLLKEECITPNVVINKWPLTLIALQKGKHNLCQKLLRIGADVNSQNDNGNYLLSIIAQNSTEEALEYVLDYYPDLNIRNKSGLTPFFVSVKKENMNIAMKLLDFGAEVNFLDKNGKSVFEVGLKIAKRIIRKETSKRLSPTSKEKLKFLQKLFGYCGEVQSKQSISGEKLSQIPFEDFISVIKSASNVVLLEQNEVLEDLNHPKRSCFLRMKYYTRLFSEDSENEAVRLNFLKEMVIKYGLPKNTPQELVALKERHRTTLRGHIWRLLLGCQTDLEYYIKLIQIGRCQQELWKKIKDDTCRTFKNLQSFSEIVSLERLDRLLNAFINDLPVDSKQTYVQGLNVLCSPFLYHMNDMDSFYCFRHMVLNLIPLYAVKTLDGVHNAVEIIDILLEYLDPTLYYYMKDQFCFSANLYGFGMVLSFFGKYPPLEDVFHLWDFMICFGFHNIILLVLSQILLLRNEFFSAKHPNVVMKNFPNLNSRKIVCFALQLQNSIPKELYEKIVTHPFANENSHIS